MPVRYFFFACLLFAAAPARAQNMDTEDTAGKQHAVVHHVQPAPPYDINEYFATHLHYPDSARSLGIEGKVVVTFEVKKNGVISRCEVLQGVNPWLDAEALRVISTMPPWQPGRNNGRPITSWVAQPVTFRLE